MENIEDVIKNFQPLTIETRVLDFEVPKTLMVKGTEVTIPHTFTRKDVHWIINSNNQLVKAAWISKPLAHFLNAYKLTNSIGIQSELKRAIQACDVEISKLIKNGVLRDKHGPGAMSFAQANENVPQDGLVISERSWQALCQANPKWKGVKTVMVVRFPNLGPGTTQKLRLIVNKNWEEKVNTPLSATSVGNRIPNLQQLLDMIEDTSEGIKEEVDNNGVIDAFYLHPETLKDRMEGDGDGDLVYIVIEEHGSPTFKKINFTRKSGEISNDLIQSMYKKANRLDRTNLPGWLGTYFDDTPIGNATYVIRWKEYIQSKKNKNSPHPMHEAWKKVGPEAIQLIEFVMDIRKGEWTDNQINTKMQYISGIMAEIKKAKESGDWFAKTVTSANVTDIPNFIIRFKSLQDYVDYITSQKSSINLQN